MILFLNKATHWLEYCNNILKNNKIYKTLVLISIQFAQNRFLPAKKSPEKKTIW